MILADCFYICVRTKKKKMNQISIKVKGSKMSLIYTPLNGRIFVPNDLLGQIPESEKLEPFRTYGTGRFTPVWVEKELKELFHAWKEMPTFSLSGDTHTYRGEEYPVAGGLKMVEVKPAKPVKTYRVNELYGSHWKWGLPSISDSKLSKVKSSYNCLSLLDTYYCFDNEAVKAFEPTYNQIVEKLQKELNRWKASQELKIGEKFLTLEVKDVVKNDNETATFHFTDGSTLHENYYWELYDTEVPESAEKVRIQWSNIEFLINGEWTDDPEEGEEIDF